ncbi:MAG: hypothetical protein ACRDOI_05470 [Trebonia sp.]
MTDTQTAQPTARGLVEETIAVLGTRQSAEEAIRLCLFSAEEAAAQCRSKCMCIRNPISCTRVSV